MRVLVTGGTGFIGKRVVNALIKGGDEVVIASRNIAKAALVIGNKCDYIQWSDTVKSLPNLEDLENIDGVINLMGEGIAEKRWSEGQKKKIYDSRIIGTRNLLEAFSKIDKKPKVFISASAIGIYGDRKDEEITEASSLGAGFLADVCKDWEAEALKAQELGMRVGLLRTGLVLGHGGGALKKMLPLFKLGAGGPLGKGDQYMSWIHVDDLANMYVELLKNSPLEGPFNGTAPYPATNTYFTKALGRTLKKPTFVKAPEFALKLVLGEMSEVLLEGQRVLPEKFKAAGFRYKYPTLEMALKETAY